MRHNNKTNALGRKSAHRKAMLSNMAASLILHKRIKTTVAKAKALRVFIEPIITKSKEDTTHSRRLAFGYLQDKLAVAELFREVSPRVHDRPGGYTRILKLGQRLGDAAEVCYIELVDFNETMVTAKAAAEAKVTRRSRRTSRKKGEGATEAKAGITSAALHEEAKADVAAPEEKHEAAAEDMIEEDSAAAVEAVPEAIPETDPEAATEEKPEASAGTAAEEKPIAEAEASPEAEATPAPEATATEEEPDQKTGEQDDAEDHETEQK